MSHFSVAVFSKNPEDYGALLAPFNEDAEDPEFLDFVEADETISELHDAYKASHAELPAHCAIDDDDFRSWVYDNKGYVWDSEHDSFGHYTNPNAKWDWYEVGGRWSNMLRLKPVEGSDPQKPEYCNSARISEIDFTPDPVNAAKATRVWELNVEGATPSPGEENLVDPLYGKEYYLDTYKTKENYVDVVACFGAYALVTPDGEWYEQGRMGWFGWSDATYESITEFRDKLRSVLNDCTPDMFVTIVDCHI